MEAHCLPDDMITELGLPLTHASYLSRYGRHMNVIASSSAFSFPTVYL